MFFLQTMIFPAYLTMVTFGKFYFHFLLPANNYAQLHFLTFTPCITTHIHQYLHQVLKRYISGNYYDVLKDDYWPIIGALNKIKELLVACFLSHLISLQSLRHTAKDCYVCNRRPTSLHPFPESERSKTTTLVRCSYFTYTLIRLFQEVVKPYFNRVIFSTPQ